MTAEKYLEKIMAYISTMESHEQKYINFMVELEQSPVHNIPIGILADIVVNLKNDIRAEHAKKSGKGTELSAAKRILKSSKKHSNTALHFAKTIGEYQYICDGFRLVKLADHLPLPELPSGVDYVNVDHFFNAERHNMASIEMPDLAQLKAHIKVQRAKQKAEGRKNPIVTFDFGKGMPIVNAEYLADMMELLPSCTVYADPQNSLNPLYFYSGNSAGMLLPMNINTTKRERTRL